MEIILVDSKQIKDLQFCTAYFTNDANGKLLLGVSFALSKNYSDNLSTNVKRGNLSSHLKGEAIGRTKHGYDTDAQDHYIKGQFWDLIQKAWKKRLQGESENVICDWLNKQGYHRQLKDAKKYNSRQCMSPQKLNKLFKDQFYYGRMFLRGDREVDLCELYDFPAMITEEEFIEVQRISRRGGTYRTERIPLPLRGKVFDAYIEGIQYKPQVIQGRENKYLRYVVDNTHKKMVKEKDREKLGVVSAKAIVEALDKRFQWLNSNFSKNQYESLIKAARKHVENEYNTREDERRRLKTIRTRAQKEHEDLVENYLLQGKTYSLEEKIVYEKKKIELITEIKNLSEKISELEKKEADLLPSFENFLNTLITLSKSYKTWSGEKKLEIADILVLNTFVHDKKVVRIELVEPFEELFVDEIKTGSEGWRALAGLSMMGLRSIFLIMWLWRILRGLG